MLLLTPIPSPSPGPTPQYDVTVTTGTDWTQIILGVVTALATLALAIVALRTLRANNTMAQATVRAAEAALDEATSTRAAADATLAQAKATAEQVELSRRSMDEAQGDRELAWQPLLSYKLVPNDRPQFPPSSVIRNTGGGPAYRSVLARRGGDGVLVSTPRFVGPGVDEGVHIMPFESDPRVSPRVVPADGWVVVCEDHFGNRFCFLSDGSQPEKLARSADEATAPWVLLWRFASMAQQQADAARQKQGDVGTSK